MGQEVGKSVGYFIGQERCTSRAMRIAFVTTGWLLQKLIFNPKYINSVSHLVLDEVHEVVALSFIHSWSCVVVVLFSSSSSTGNASRGRHSRSHCADGSVFMAVCLW